MKPSCLALAGLSLFLGSVGAYAQGPNDVAPPPSAVEEQVFSKLPGPPALDSSGDRLDWATLKHLQDTRTVSDCKRAKSEVKISLMSFYGPPYGPLSEQEVRAITPAFDEIREQSFHPNLIGAAKKHWNRPRPFLSHEDAAPCVSKDPKPSYPSGHAALAQLFYHVLAEIYPNRAKALEDRAHQIAWDRVIGGAHYPTDVRDGKKLGDEVYQFMKVKPEYRKTMQKLKAAAEMAARFTNVAPAANDTSATAGTAR